MKKYKLQHETKKKIHEKLAEQERQEEYIRKAREEEEGLRILDGYENASKDITDKSDEIMMGGYMYSSAKQKKAKKSKKIKKKKNIKKKK